MQKRGPLPVLGTLMLVTVLIWGGLKIWGVINDQSAPISDLSYEMIEKQISRGSSLTEAQLAQRISDLQGKKVRWTGWVEEVDGDNMVFIDMDRLLYDVRFPLPAQEALRLNKGNQVTFVGVIDQVERYWFSVRVQLRSVQVDSIAE